MTKVSPAATDDFPEAAPATASAAKPAAATAKPAAPTAKPAAPSQDARALQARVGQRLKVPEAEPVRRTKPGTETPVTERLALDPGSAPEPDRRRPVQRSTGSRRQTSETATALLGLEREARRAESEAELSYLIVNGSRAAVQYRQAMLLMRVGKTGHRVVSVSSLSAIDRNATLIRWVEGMVATKVGVDNIGKVVSFDARRETAVDDIDATTYPFPRMALVPLTMRDGTVFAHLLVARETAWEETDLVATARLCETYSHAWEALAGPKRIKRKLRSRTAILGALASVAFLAGFLPVPLTVLAPAEISAARPHVVASPVDGVVDAILVEPNQRVKPGDALFTLADTDLRNRVQLAGEAVGVAQARYTQAVRNSFADVSAKRELSIAESELALKRAEYDYAVELLDKSVIRADAAGIAVFSSRDEWIGRPVATGERIMRVADPERVNLTVHLPVGDAIVADEGARVRLYLDSDPLKPLEAALISSSFHARPDAAGVLSYTVRAAFGAGEAPRIGLRGTAQIYGERVSLFYYLFRKPLAAVRQFTGL